MEWLSNLWSRTTLEDPVAGNAEAAHSDSRSSDDDEEDEDETTPSDTRSTCSTIDPGPGPGFAWPQAALQRSNGRVETEMLPHRLLSHAVPATSAQAVLSSRSSASSVSSLPQKSSIFRTIVEEDLRQKQQQQQAEAGVEVGSLTSPTDGLSGTTGMPFLSRAASAAAQHLLANMRHERADEDEEQIGPTLLNKSIESEKAPEKARASILQSALGPASGAWTQLRLRGALVPAATAAATTATTTAAATTGTSSKASPTSAVAAVGGSEDENEDDEVGSAPDDEVSHKQTAGEGLDLSLRQPTAHLSTDSDWDLDGSKGTWVPGRTIGELFATNEPALALRPVHTAARTRTTPDIPPMPPMEERSGNNSSSFSSNPFHIVAGSTAYVPPKADMADGKRHELECLSVPSEQLLDFELSAKIFLETGRRAGLVFRHADVSNNFFALTIDMKAGTLQLNRGAKPSHRLKPFVLSDHTFPTAFPIVAEAQQWHCLRVRCSSGWLDISFDGSVVGRCPAPVVERILETNRPNQRLGVTVTQHGQLAVTEVQGLSDKEASVGDLILTVNGVTDVDSISAELTQSTAKRIVIGRPGSLDLVGLWVGKHSRAKIKDVEVVDLEIREAVAPPPAQASSEIAGHVGARMSASSAVQRIQRAVRVWQSHSSEVETSPKVDLVSPSSAGISPCLAHQEPSQGMLTARIPGFGPKERPETLLALSGSADQGLEARYEQRRPAIDAARTAALRALGNDDYERLRSLEIGFASRQKATVAQKCWNRAMQATTERDHQKFLRMAFCLENDSELMKDVGIEELDKWFDEQEVVRAEAEEKERRRLARKASRKAKSGTQVFLPSSSPSKRADVDRDRAVPASKSDVETAAV